MTELLLAAAFLLVTHLGLAALPVRSRLVGLLGKWPYLGLYSAIAVGAFVWLVKAWAAAPIIELWPQNTAFARHLALAVMPFVSVLFISGYTMINPTAVILDQVNKAGDADKLPGPVRITRHPVMWAVALWAAVHIVANGDLAAQVFFGTLAILALWGARLSDRRRLQSDPEGFEPLRRRTSYWPFRAVIQGRAPKGEFTPFGWWRVALGLGLYVAFIFGHGPVIGVPLMPGLGG